MPVPKKKLSRSRTGHRKSQFYKATSQALVSCPHCKAKVKPHNVCGKCGMYNGKQVLKVG